MALLITGGLGYIGSHIAKIYQKKKLIIIDNKSNSILNYKKILPHAKVYIKNLNYKNLQNIFSNNDIKCVIHLAGLKSVSESSIRPLDYYKNNVSSSCDLLECMDKYRIQKLIFSSSATVYGNDNKSPLKENMKTEPINPYGRTKLIIENIIRDYCSSNKKFSSVALRYFNPIGAHPSGELSDKPKGDPQNIMPKIINSIFYDKLKVFGNDYNTKDGTCVRDYIHVMDLAECHLKFINYLNKNKGFEIFNVGLGKGVSVLELIKIFEKANKLKINFRYVKRRDGDLAISFSSNSKLKKMIGWTPKKTYLDMCKDAWSARNSHF